MCRHTMKEHKVHEKMKNNLYNMNFFKILNIFQISNFYKLIEVFLCIYISYIDEVYIYYIDITSLEAGDFGNYVVHLP